MDRTKAAPLTYGVPGGTFQGILEADRDVVYGHTDALQTQDELIGTLLSGTGGKGQVGTIALTADGATHQVTAPTLTTYMVAGIVYKLAAPVFQGFTHNAVSYVFARENKTLRVSASSTEAADDCLIASVDDTGADPVVNMNPTGKVYAGTLGTGADGTAAGVLSGCIYQVYTTNGTADVEDEIAHGLGRVPKGYILVKKDKACDIYTGGTPWTATNIYLKCSVVSAEVTVLIF